MLRTAGLAHHLTQISWWYLMSLYVLVMRHLWCCKAEGISSPTGRKKKDLDEVGNKVLIPQSKG